MTPPSSLFNRRPLPPERTWPETRDPAWPELDLSAGESARRTALDGYAETGWRILTRAGGPEARSRLPEGIATCESQALAGNVRLYPMALRLRTAHLSAAETEAERESAREASRVWAEHALPAILGSELSARDKASILFENAVALSALLNSENSLASTDRALLLSYFVQIRALQNQAELESARDPELPEFPPYLATYARAQEALLDEPPQPRFAFQEFLATRRHLSEGDLSGEFRQRISQSTEAALLNFPRDLSGVQRQNLRTYYGLYALLLFDQIDGGAPEAAEALLRAASEQLSGSGRGTTLRPLLASLAAENPEVRPTAERLLQALTREPYATVLARDEEDRPLRQAAQAIESSTELREALIQALRASPQATPQELALLLSEYGAGALDLLASLPASLRDNPARRNLARCLMTENVEPAPVAHSSLVIPLEAMLRSLGRISEREERYAPACAQIFRDLAESSEAADLPLRLRQQAQRALQRLTDFNPSRLLRHLTSSEALLTLFAGIAFTELAPLAFLRWARNGSLWMRGGRLTWQAQLASGVGIGFATSSLGAVHHLASSPRPVMEEIGEMWPAFALNTLAGSVAMGGTMLAGHGWRRLFLPQEAATYLGLRHTALRGSTFLTGGTLMLGAHTLSETALTGHLRRPSGEEAAETYISMALWDLGAAAVHRGGNHFWWRAQLGPQRLQEQVRPLLHVLEQRNPWLVQTPAEQSRLEAILGRPLARDQALPEIFRGLAEHRIPYWHESRLAFRERSEGYRNSESQAVTPEDLAQLHSLPMHEGVREILLNPRFQPVTQVRAGERDFYLSRILRTQSEGGERNFVLALVPVTENGQTTLKRRFFYVSNSDAGGWRASSAVILDGHILKGPRHYTQDTQVVPEILETLIQMESLAERSLAVEYETLLPHLSLSDPLADPQKFRSQIGGMDRELAFPSLRGLTDLRGLQPGRAFRRRGRPVRPGEDAPVLSGQELIDQLTQINYPEGFVPDFTAEPRRIFTIPRSLLGEVRLREYGGAYVVESSSGRSRPILWVMGEDGAGRAWVKWIRYADVSVNSYGIYSEVIDSGILTSKPLEYHQQAGALPEEYRPHFDFTYADITPALSLLQPIREYMAARGLPPREPTQP